MLVVVAVAGCGAGLLAGVRSGPLWLDETLSVEIARLPLPELYDALRQDGAPPLYYLLLRGWMAAFGEGTVAVRLLSVVLTAVALGLAYLLGSRLVSGPPSCVASDGPSLGVVQASDARSAGRAAVVVLAALPWTMRFGSETRMYLLVVVLVLCGALALLAVHRSGSRWAVVGLAAVVAGLLLTHYWSLFLLAAVGLLHLPGLLRRRPACVRVALAGLLGGLAFGPWLPTFLFQAAHTGAPWADPVRALELLRTPLYWGGGTDQERAVLAAVLVPLAVWAAVRWKVGRLAVGVVFLTLLMAWTSVYIGGGAYTGRYTAVVVPLLTTAAALGAVGLPGRRLPLLALSLAALIGLGYGIPAAGNSRSSAEGVASAFLRSAAPGDLLVYCPDQLGPPVARLLGEDYPQVVYPTLGSPERVDWVDYRGRQDAADPVAFAARVDALAGDRPVYLLSAREYRTFEGDCEALLRGLGRLRGPVEHLFGTLGTTGQLLFRFPAR